MISLKLEHAQQPRMGQSQKGEILWQKNYQQGFRLEGVLAYFMHLKCQKRIGDDVGDLIYVLCNLLCKNMTPNALKCVLLP
jgi:hypothetical protein